MAGVPNLFNVNGKASAFPLATNPLEQIFQNKMASWNSNGPVPTVQTSPSMNAGNVAIPSSLTSTFGTIGTQGATQIGQNYQQAAKQLGNDAAIRGESGVPSGSYASQRLGTQQGLDLGNLDASVGGVAANTAYQGALNQRDFNQQSQLANLIGYYNRPTPLQQVFSGIGAGAGAAGTGAGLYQQFGIGSSGGSNGINPYASSTPAPTSLIPTDPSGYENYGYPGYGGGF